MILSDKLAAVVGSKEIPFSQVKEALLSIIKERRLNTPKNWQPIKSDDDLSRQI